MFVFYTFSFLVYFSYPLTYFKCKQTISTSKISSTTFSFIEKKIVDVALSGRLFMFNMLYGLLKMLAC